MNAEKIWLIANNKATAILFIASPYFIPPQLPILFELVIRNWEHLKSQEKTGRTSPKVVSSRMRKFLALIAVLTFLTSCGSNSSTLENAKGKEACDLWAQKGSDPVERVLLDKKIQDIFQELAIETNKAMYNTFISLIEKEITVGGMWEIEKDGDPRIILAPINDFCSKG